MPSITRLEPHPTRRDARTVHLDGEPWGTIPGTLADELGLYEGRELSAAELAEIETEAARGWALEAALAALAVRRRSRAELARQLRGKGYAAVAVDAALSRCEELGYLDDRSFAAAFARDRIRARPQGVARMRAELRRRGVAEADAEAGIEEAFEEEGTAERDLLERAARRRWSALRGLEPEAAERRLAAYLLRRGFSPPSVREIVRHLTAEDR